MVRAAAGERIDHLMSSLRLGTATVGIGRGGAFFPLCLFCIKILVRFGEQFFDAFAIAAVGGYADTGGERRLFSVLGENFADTIRDTMRIVFCRFRENEGEFVAPVTRGGIDGTAMNGEDIGHAAYGAAAQQMAE